MIPPSIDQYIDRLNQIPKEAKSKLFQIRALDKQVMSLQIKVEDRRQKALEKMIQYQSKPNSKLRNQVNQILKQINDMYQTMLAHSRQKLKLSDQIYNCIDTPTEELNRDLANKIKSHQVTEITKTSKYKRPNKNNCNYIDIVEQQFFASEPKYCYCHRPSFGLMVQCSSQLCDLEWFHRQCIEQKNLGQKWFCKDCRKNRTKVMKCKT